MTAKNALAGGWKLVWIPSSADPVFAAAASGSSVDVTCGGVAVVTAGSITTLASDKIIYTLPAVATVTVDGVTGINTHAAKCAGGK